MEKRYSISDAAKQVSVEAHVLRYWEEELNLHIQRNAQGHRFYLEEDISILKSIKDLKEQGFQLKAIKMVLPDIKVVRTLEPQKLYRLREELNRQVQGEDAYTPAPVQGFQRPALRQGRSIRGDDIPRCGPECEKLPDAADAFGPLFQCQEVRVRGPECPQ